jgi:hypothetical protein
MKDGTTAAVVVVAAAATVGGVYYLTRKASAATTCNVSNLTLNASPLTVDVGGSVEFTAVALDSNGNPVDNVSITLAEVTTGTTSTPATTDSSGTADFSVTFPSDTAPGNYVFVAEAC